MNPNNHPDEHWHYLEYSKRIASKLANGVNGLLPETAQAWNRLLLSDSPSDTEVNALLEQLDAEDLGTAWHELTLFAHGWAYFYGLAKEHQCQHYRDWGNKKGNAE